MLTDLLFAATSGHVIPSIENWQAAFQIDIIGLLTLIEAAIPHLAARPGTGSIVIVSSLAGYEAKHPTGTGPYSILKRAQSMLAKDYSRKYGSEGIRVNAILPACIETPSVTLPDGTYQPSTFEVKRKEYPEAIEALIKSVPLGRTGTPEETANVVVFLASPLASFVSGASLAVDGGMSNLY